MTTYGIMIQNYILCKVKEDMLQEFYYYTWCIKVHHEKNMYMLDVMTIIEAADSSVVRNITESTNDKEIALSIE